MAFLYLISSHIVWIGLFCLLFQLEHKIPRGRKKASSRFRTPRIQLIKRILKSTITTCGYLIGDIQHPSVWKQLLISSNITMNPPFLFFQCNYIAIFFFLDPYIINPIRVHFACFHPTLLRFDFSLRSEGKVGFVLIPLKFIHTRTFMLFWENMDVKFMTSG